MRRLSMTPLWATALLGAVLLGGCGDGGAKNARTVTSYPYTIVTTCGMVTDIVREVAGEHAKVNGLMGPGVDPHLHKPSRDDVKALLAADAIFYAGLMLEGRMADSFTKVARTGKPVFAVTEELDKGTLLEPAGFAGHWDPHVWMDVGAWSKGVAAVARALATIDPPHAADYQARAAAYQARLKTLDDYVRKVIGSIPKERRVLVTAHDAFNYFGRAYDIEVRGIQGISTESAAGLHDINGLVDLLVDRKIAAVFVESSVAEDNVRSLMEGASKRKHTVRIGGELFSDAMGPGDLYEGTYIGMLDHNATVIARALGGQAPETGMQGKLTYYKKHGKH